MDMLNDIHIKVRGQIEGIGSEDGMWTIKISDKDLYLAEPPCRPISVFE